MASENLAADRNYLVLQYSVTILAYPQQVLGLADLFGTSAKCIVFIYMITFYLKNMKQTEVGYRLLNMT